MNELDRGKVTFEQAEGLEPLPAQLQPKELSAALRARLWYVLYHGLDKATHHSEFDNATIKDPWLTILFEMHIFRFHKPADEFRPYAKPLIEEMKSLIMNESYSQVFGTIQWILRRPQCPHDLPKVIASVLRSCRAGYRLSDDGRTFLPIASEEEAQIAKQAFAALNRKEYAGARITQLFAFSKLLSFILAYGKEIDPKPIRVGSDVMCLSLPDLESESFIECGSLVEVLYITGNP